jgi:hypothetical protein
MGFWPGSGRSLLRLPGHAVPLVICVEKYAPVVADARKKIPSSGGLLRDAIGRRQALGVLLQALGAKELGANRLLHVGRSSDRALCDAHHVWCSG